MILKDKILMNCRAAATLVEKKRDKKLSVLERLGLWVHLGYCKMCGLFYKQAEIIDKCAKAYANKIESGTKTYSMNERKKDEINRGIHEHLNSEN